MDFRGLIRDLCALIGVILVGYGSWLAWPPAGFIISGSLLLLLALVGEFLSRFRRIFQSGPR